MEDDRYPLDRNVLIKEIEAVRTVRDSQSTPSEEDQTTFTPGYILHNLPAVASCWYAAWCRMPTIGCAALWAAA